MAEKRIITTSDRLFWAGAGVVLVMASVMLLFWNRLPPQLPWLYSFPWGEKQLLGKWWFVWIFAGMEGVLFATRLIANWAGKDDSTVQNTVMIGVLTTVILMAASFFKIMSIFLSI